MHINIFLKEFLVCWTAGKSPPFCPWEKGKINRNHSCPLWHWQSEGFWGTPQTPQCATWLGPGWWQTCKARRRDQTMTITELTTNPAVSSPADALQAKPDMGLWRGRGQCQVQGHVHSRLLQPLLAFPHRFSSVWLFYFIFLCTWEIKQIFFLYVIFVASGLFLFPLLLSFSPRQCFSLQWIPLEVSGVLHFLHLAPFWHHVNTTMIANNRHTTWWKALHMVANTLQCNPATTPLLFTASRNPSFIDLTQLIPNDP